MMRLPTITGLAAAFLFVVTTASASPFLVTLDTSSLSGMQTLIFGLTNSDGASNSIAMSAFSFDGGSAATGTVDCTLGGSFSGLGCSGDLNSAVALEDLDPVGAFFTQQFLPGAS